MSSIKYLNMPDSTYNFNQHDYEFRITITNGTHTVELKPEGWDNLYIEEDIFDWWIKGSIEIKSPHDSFERGSEEISLLGVDEKTVIYKFRNDGRDTIIISARPKEDARGVFAGNFVEEKWLLEFEAVIYDTEDYKHTMMMNKVKKLMFHEKVYQLMKEKNIEFTTSNVGTNKGNTDIHKLNDDARSLPTGEALGELLKNDDDFSKHTQLVGNEQFWNNGDVLNKIMYTSGSNTRFISDVDYMLSRHTAAENDDFQPCIFKLERKPKNEPKQFSLMSVKKYFEQAGKEQPGKYQIEHIFLDEHSQTSAANEVTVPKAPLSQSNSAETEFKSNDFSNTSNFQLIDMSGLDYADNLANRVVVSFNAKDGQFNIESNNHRSEKYKDFFKESIIPNVLTKQEDDRLPLTRFVQDGFNTQHVYSPYNTDKQRLVEGRNKILKYYMFTNLGINLVLRGLTHRQPGRFFGLSKQQQNLQEHDDKLEGQYFITNVIHYFSTSQRGYFTEMMGVKVHTYQEQTKLEDGNDVNTI